MSVRSSWIGETLTATSQLCPSSSQCPCRSFDVLEAVEVDVQQRRSGARPAVPGGDLLEVCPIRQAGQRIVHRQCLEDIRQALEQCGDREQPERAVRPAHHDILVPVLDVASEDRLGSQRQGKVGGQDQ